MYKEELKKLRYAFISILFADAMLVATSRVDLGSNTLNETVSEETLLDSESNEETSLVEEAKITSESDLILQEETHKIEEKNYCTDDYYFIHLDNNFYLTTCTNGDYYEVTSKELVGTILETKKHQKKESDKPFPAMKWELYEASYEDYNSHDGEYGYGKNISAFSRIPLSQFLSTESFCQEEFAFLSSNSSELKRKIREKFYYDTASITTEYVYEWKMIIHNEYAKEEIKPLTQYICQTNDGKKYLFLGYRCSYNVEDMGYDYIYDILRGSYTYIGIKKENHFIQVSEIPYDNSDHKTLQELRDSFQTKEETINMISEKNSFENNIAIEKIEESNTANETICMNRLYVLDTGSNEVERIYGEMDKYYLLMNTYSLYIDEEDYMIYSFEDSINKGAFAQADNNNGIFHLSYMDEVNGCFVECFGEEVSTILVDLNQFLIENNLPNLVNETGEYSNAEMAIIQEHLREINNAKMIEAKQKWYQ